MYAPSPPIRLISPTSKKAKAIIFVPDVEFYRNTLGVQRINFSPCLIFFLKWAEKLAKSIKRAYLCSPQVIKTRAGVQEFTLKC